jgi:hypothetical protein
MSELDAERIAKRLGLTDAVTCQLRAHGYLQRLALRHTNSTHESIGHTSPTSRETPNLPALNAGQRTLRRARFGSLILPAPLLRRHEWPSPRVCELR